MSLFLRGSWDRFAPMEWYYIWLFVAALLAVWVLRAAKSSAAKWIVLVSAVFLAFCFSSALWTNGHLDAVGCEGNIMKGLICPDGTLLTKFAMLHQVMGLLGFIYLCLFMPIIFLVIGKTEWSSRKSV